VLKGWISGFERRIGAAARFKFHPLLILLCWKGGFLAPGGGVAQWRGSNSTLCFLFCAERVDFWLREEAEREEGE